MHLPIIFLSTLINLIVCRDFYIGMFKRNDFLVAQDRLYQERVYNRRVIAKYGRIFKCPITYLRIVDRLGIGRGPTVEILRGGLLKNFVVLRLQSMYNYPISVNIYVGCENIMAREMTIATTASTAGKSNDVNITTAEVTTDVSKDDKTDNDTTITSTVNNTSIADISNSTDNTT